MVNCQTVRDRLSPYLDGELGAAERSRVEDHLGTCPDCSLHHEELKRVQRALDSLSRDPVPVSEDFSDQLLTQLRREFHLTGPGAPTDDTSTSFLPETSSMVAVLTLIVGLLVGTYLGIDFLQSLQTPNSPPPADGSTPDSTATAPHAPEVVSFRDAYFELAESRSTENSPD